MGKFLFTQATKDGAFARVALIGPPGSGKTWTALTIARGLEGAAGVTAVIDTEHGSASKYAHIFDFKHLVMTEFNPADLTIALADAADQGITTVIIDSWSHFWEGSGGMLEQVDLATIRAGRSDKFGSGWKEMRPVERDMLDAILGYPGHVITCLRTKVDTVLTLNPATGKHEPKRVGLKAVQRDGLEYEFDLVGDMDDATLTITKSRCPELTRASIKEPTDELGHQIDAWLKLAAVGDPFNPLTVRDWALAPGRTLDEIRQKTEDLVASGHGGGAVNAPNGSTYSIADFLRQRWREINREIKQAQGATVGVIGGGDQVDQDQDVAA